MAALYNALYRLRSAFVAEIDEDGEDVVRSPCEKCGRLTHPDDLCGDDYCRRCHVSVSFESCVDGMPALWIERAAHTGPTSWWEGGPLCERIAAWGLALCKRIESLRPMRALPCDWPTASGEPHCYQCAGCGSSFATGEMAGRCACPEGAVRRLQLMVARKGCSEHYE